MFPDCRAKTAVVAYVYDKMGIGVSDQCDDTESFENVFDFPGSWYGTVEGDINEFNCLVPQAYMNNGVAKPGDYLGINSTDREPDSSVLNHSGIS